jgi:hypothetical protein
MLLLFLATASMLVVVLAMSSDHAVLSSCCGVVWCGVVWCGVVWCGVVWCGVVWSQ